MLLHRLSGTFPTRTTAGCCPSAAGCQQPHKEPCDARRRPDRPYWAAPFGGAERPRRGVRFARLIHRGVRVGGRTEGPRRLRRQSRPALVVTGVVPPDSPSSMGEAEQAENRKRQKVSKPVKKRRSEGMDILGRRSENPQDRKTSIHQIAIRGAEGRGELWAGLRQSSPRRSPLLDSAHGR